MYSFKKKSFIIISSFSSWIYVRSRFIFFFVVCQSILWFSLIYESLLLLPTHFIELFILKSVTNWMIVLGIHYSKYTPYMYVRRTQYILYWEMCFFERKKQFNTLSLALVVHSNDIEQWMSVNFICSL